MILYLDTTANTTVGIVDEKNNWIDLVFESNAKATQYIHQQIFSILETNNRSLKDVDSLFYMAGPGSYTGMRVSEGIADLLQWNQIKSYSLYHHEIPKLCGFKSGEWIADAFKGEYFVYTWDENNEKTRLVKKNEFRSASNNIFSHSMIEDVRTINTADLIKDNISLLLEYVFDNNVKNELYYYRSLEDEFQRC